MLDESVKELRGPEGNSHGFKFQIGDSEEFEAILAIEDPVPTGRQILAKAGRRPEKDYQLLLLTKEGDLEEIGLDETVDLREPRVEQFFAFLADRIFYFVIDERRFPWGATSIAESTLKFLAQVPANYSVWLERKGSQEDLLIQPGTKAPLTEKGVEVFFTGLDQTNAGNGLQSLPLADQRYFAEHDLKAELVEDKGKKGLILHDFQLPSGVFEHERCDILVLLPPGYPDAPPDMFYADPWLKLKTSGRFPNRADTSHKFSNRNWQRWSRHNKEWRAGIDTFRTFLQRILSALAMAA